MAEPRDDALRKRYRELATEEPSAALDGAIRAAARRAVSSGPGAIRKPGAARWAVPVSLAAVLFLSFSVVMRLEKEAPPIGEPTPSVVASPPPASFRAEDARAQARRRRSSPGVSGTRSTRMRRSDSASSTAEATTAATGSVPDSPTPLSPSGFSGDGVSR